MPKLAARDTGNMTQTFALQVHDLHKHFGSIHAVDGVNLTVPTGCVMALLGPNGAGKTTTLDMALNLSRPTSGSVRVLGTTPGEAITAGRISAVLQTGGLLGDMRVHEALAWIAATYGGGVSSRENLERVLEQAGIASIARRKIRKCSGGEQQRVKFALALLPDPDLLILDEPTAGMDATARHEFWQTMHAQATSGKTIIFATHYLQEAQDYAERVVLMNHGKIVADGSPAEITACQQRVVSFVASDAAAAQIREHYPQIELVKAGGRFQVSLAQTDDFVRFALAVPGVENLEVAQPSLEQAFFDLTDLDSDPSVDSRLAPHENNTTTTQPSLPSRATSQTATSQTATSKEN